MGVPRFEVKRSAQSKFQWMYFNAAGKAIAEGSPVPQKELCYQEIRLIKDNAMHSERYRTLENGGTKFGFQLTAPNRKLLAESISFSTKEERDEALAETKRSGEAAVVEPKK